MPDESFSSIFRGNIVVPTGNPFSASAAEERMTLLVDQSSDDGDSLWLGPSLLLLQDHVLAVSRDGIIRRLEPAERFFLDTQRIRYDSTITKLTANEFLCPGMIDLHIHAPQYAFTGTATDRPLMGADGWLETYTFPAEQSLIDLDKARTVYQGVVQSTLRTGTTTAVYFATLHLEPCKVLVDTTITFGQRALVGKVCMDRFSPDNYCQSLEENVRETEALIEYIYHKAGRRRRDDSTALLPLVLPIVTPRFIPTCTPSLLSELCRLANQHECHITSHISESIDEVAFSRHLDANEDLGDGEGRSDAVIFDSHGLLTDQCIMAHGVHLGEDDMDLMKARKSAVAHCPLSNFFFAGGSLPCRWLLERGNKCGLGTDVAGGYSPSMLHSSRMAVVASQAVQHQALLKGSKENHLIDYRHAFYLATLGGAEALGLEDRIGTFRVGMEFDAMILSGDTDSSRIQIFQSDTVSDVFQKLCLLGDDRNVKRVFVQGRDVTIQES